MRKRLFKYLATLIAAMLLMQSALAGQSVAIYLNEASTICSTHAENITNLDHTTKTNENNHCDDHLKINGDELDTCNHNNPCSFSCASLFNIALPTVELEVVALNINELRISLRVPYRSHQYSPPVPPPLSF